MHIWSEGDGVATVAARLPYSGTPACPPTTPCNARLRLNLRLQANGLMLLTITSHGFLAFYAYPTLAASSAPCTIPFLRPRPSCPRPSSPHAQPSWLVRSTHPPPPTHLVCEVAVPAHHRSSPTPKPPSGFLGQRFCTHLVGEVDVPAHHHGFEHEEVVHREDGLHHEAGQLVALLSLGYHLGRTRPAVGSGVDLCVLGLAHGRHEERRRWASCARTTTWGGQGRPERVGLGV